VTEARETLKLGGRVLVIGTDELIGRSTHQLLADIDAPHLEAFGMPASIAAAAFVGGSAPVALVPEVSSRAEADRALALCSSGTRVVTLTSPNRARQLLEQSPSTVSAASIGYDPDTPMERFVRLPRERFGHPLSGKPRDRIVLALGASDGPNEPPLPPGLIQSLIERGVAPSTVATALAEQVGWSRNRAYEFALRAEGVVDPER
jgi:hypothetical protein